MPGRWITTKHGQRVYIGGEPGARKVAVVEKPGGELRRQREREITAHEGRTEERVHHRTYDAASPTDARKQHRRLYPKGKIHTVELAYSIPKSVKHPGGRVYRVSFEQ